jgi:hypothetical protein
VPNARNSAPCWRRVLQCRARQSEGAVASKKTQRAIAAHDVPGVVDDICIDRVAKLLAPHEISAGARDEIEHHINWYRSGRSWRGQGPRIEMPPEFHQMREAVAALANLVNGVGVDRVVSIFFAAELFDAPHLLPDDQAIQDRLERMLADLKDFDNRLTAVLKHGRRRGRKTDRARHLVRIVASAIERDKGKPIKRSKNKGSLFELLMDIVAVADPEIGPGTVDEELKARSQRRRGEIKL